MGMSRPPWGVKPAAGSQPLQHQRLASVLNPTSRVTTARKRIPMQSPPRRLNTTFKTDLAWALDLQRLSTHWLNLKYQIGSREYDQDDSQLIGTVSYTYCTLKDLPVYVLAECHEPSQSEVASPHAQVVHRFEHQRYVPEDDLSFFESQTELVKMRPVHYRFYRSPKTDDIGKPKLFVRRLHRTAGADDEEAWQEAPLYRFGLRTTDTAYRFFAGLYLGHTDMSPIPTPRDLSRLSHYATVSVSTKHDKPLNPAVELMERVAKIDVVQDVGDVVVG
jgi:hypothetical protein